MGHRLSNIECIINHGKDILKKLIEKHHGPRTYLVFSSRLGQGGMKSGIDLFTEFPEMFLPEDIAQKVEVKLKEKERIGKQLSTKSEEAGRRMRELNGRFLPSDEKEINGLKEIIKGLESEINELLARLFVKDDVFVEIRFEQLNFEFIQKLKEDPLVSQDFTTKEKRSINIVLFRVNDIEANRLLLASRIIRET